MTIGGLFRLPTTYHHYNTTGAPQYNTLNWADNIEMVCEDATDFHGSVMSSWINEDHEGRLMVDDGVVVVDEDDA